MQMRVMGYKHSKGDFNGQAYDYVTIYCVAKLKSSDNQRGFAGIEMRGEPQLLEKMQKINFSGPVVCEVQTETVAIGKGAYTEMVTMVTPLDKNGQAEPVK
ncbi:hypothetical protein [Methylomonas sp. HYX-M1]|uniref:hypothetical protein n=1 Tax=Methylomonas sp. HYX-M1 TaxID=3139307 RepID=UPI00345C1526